LNYFIKKIKPNNVSKLYIDTINHNQTKRFIKFSKLGRFTKSKKDLVDYIKNLPSNEILYGVFKRNVHLANFKLTLNKNYITIGFLVFLKFQNKGILKKVFPKILNLKVFNSKKYKNLMLGVNKKNLNAIKLYKKMGFNYKKNSKKIMFLKIN
tara:strand:- start:1142 stop:1600 length:459 start_codon:yes stop_codon:yes gene_type:complete